MRILYWFRRDLRLEDNRALAEAASRADRIAAVFIIDSDELRDRKMGFDDPRFAFLLDALKRLEAKVKLHVFYGKTREVFEHLLGRYEFDAVYTAAPLSWHEDAKVGEVRELFEEEGIRLVEKVDNVLVDPCSLGSPINFKTFYRRWRRMVDAWTVGEPPPELFTDLDEPNLEELSEKLGWRLREDLPWRADWCDHRLRSMDFRKYDKDSLHLDGTSKLSPYISLGVVSIRSVFNRAAEASEEFVRQLAWREFYYHLKLRHPHMKGLELKPHMRGLGWENHQPLIEAFKEGRTGYPIVDASVRQLKKEKWVHNRARLIAASFLVKDLLVDWRIGEEFFKEHLIDYDEVLNVGNWQWAASVGVDPLPIRIFNPIRQAKRYDPSCQYIKKHIPELRSHRCEELHDPVGNKIKGYYEPVVDHHEQMKKFKEMLRRGRELYHKRQSL